MATQGGKVLTVLCALGLGVSGVGCGKVKRTFNDKSDGVIVQTRHQSKEDIQKLFPANDVSVISQKEQIFKIQNTTLKEVKNKMPTSYAEENILYNMKDPALDVSNKALLSKRASIQDVIIKLNCIKLDNGPIANMKVVNEEELHLVASNTVEVGSLPIIFSSEGSQGSVMGNVSTSNPLVDRYINKKSTSQINVHWVVEAPQGSKTQEESTEAEVVVTPDRPGGYTVVVIVQDPVTQACDIAGTMLGATHNKKYNGGEGTKGIYDAEKFFHVPLVNAEKAWETTQGEGVTIAVIDSGVNYNHADLSENIKMNAAEIEGNGIDDDANGFVDDVYGWDFAIGDEYPYDDESHGTHVAGLAASSVSGIAKSAKILPIKAMLPTGMGSTASIVASIYYAIEQKADIINMSLGGKGKASPLLLAAVQKAKSQGILIVAASGNMAENTDVTPNHLTAFDGSNILSIAATDEYDHLTKYSNYGKKSVDIAAPGGTQERPLLSTFSQNDLASYIAYPGTSMACPLAAGIAALVKSVNPNLNAEEIKAILVQSGKSVPELAEKLNSGKVLDANSAVYAAQEFTFLLARE